MVISGGETQYSGDPALGKGAMKAYLYDVISVTDEVFKHLNENAEHDFLQYVPPGATQMSLPL